MPKSRNRKNHKKKVAARNKRLEAQQKQMMEKNGQNYKKNIRRMEKAKEAL